MSSDSDPQRPPRSIPPAGIDADRDLLLRDGRVAAIEAPGKLKPRQNEPPRSSTPPASSSLPASSTSTSTCASPARPTRRPSPPAPPPPLPAASPPSSPCPTPCRSTTRSKRTRWMQSPERGAAIRVFAMPAATSAAWAKRSPTTPSLKAAGAVGFTDDGKPILGDAIMRQALAAAARLGLPVIQHAEDTRITGGCTMNAGARRLPPRPARHAGRGRSRASSSATSDCCARSNETAAPICTSSTSPPPPRWRRCARPDATACTSPARSPRTTSRSPKKPSATTTPTPR